LYVSNEVAASSWDDVATACAANPKPSVPTAAIPIPMNIGVRLGSPTSLVEPAELSARAIPPTREAKAAIPKYPATLRFDTLASAALADGDSASTTGLMSSG